MDRSRADHDDDDGPAQPGRAPVDRGEPLGAFVIGTWGRSLEVWVIGA